MKIHPQNQKRLVRISELVTLRDDLLDTQRMLAGKANAYGFAMRVPENLQKVVQLTEWIKTHLSPVSLLTKLCTSALERLRKMKTTSHWAKKLLLATEAVVFWVKASYDLASTGNILGLAKFSSSLILKAATLLNLSLAEKLQHAMDALWKASLEFHELSFLVIKDIDREVKGLSLNHASEA